MPVLVDDLNNYIISFDRKVLVTNLLDEYGGMLEELAKTVSKFLAAEEANGKKFLKTFLLRGVEGDSANEVITVVPEEKLEQRKEQLRDAHSVLYSAETDGGSKCPPVTFEPLKHFAITLDSLEVKDTPKQAANETVTNGTASSAKEEKQLPKKTGALGAMFQKQEAAAATSKKSPAKKPEPEKKTGALGAMFKKQESKKASDTVSAEFKSPETEKTTKSTQEKSKKSGPASKKGLSGFLTKKDDDEKPKPSVLKPPTPKKVDDFFKKEAPKKPKEEPAANVSVNLFEESSSSSDEEALDALKREVLTDDEEDKPSTSNKRRRIVDSDDEDTGPEVKIERKELKDEPMDEDDESVKSSETFMDDDGFIVTVKAKNKRPAPANKTQSAPAASPVNVKKESPKSPAKKETSSKTPAAKKKQGNIMSFFTKK